MGIKLKTDIFNVIRQVQKSGVFTIPQMREVETVVSYLRLVKEEATAVWIEQHKIDYLTGLLQGFSADNSQASQLKDIHTLTAEEALQQQKTNMHAAYTK